MNRFLIIFLVIVTIIPISLIQLFSRLFYKRDCLLVAYYKLWVEDVFKTND